MAMVFLSSFLYFFFLFIIRAREWWREGDGDTTTQCRWEAVVVQRELIGRRVWLGSSAMEVQRLSMEMVREEHGGVVQVAGSGIVGDGLKSTGSNSTMVWSYVSGGVAGCP